MTSGHGKIISIRFLESVQRVKTYSVIKNFGTKMIHPPSSAPMNCPKRSSSLLLALQAIWPSGGYLNVKRKELIFKFTITFLTSANLQNATKLSFKVNRSILVVKRVRRDVKDFA